MFTCMHLFAQKVLFMDKIALIDIQGSFNKRSIQYIHFLEKQFCLQKIMIFPLRLVLDFIRNNLL